MGLHYIEGYKLCVYLNEFALLPDVMRELNNVIEAAHERLSVGSPHRRSQWAASEAQLQLGGGKCPLPSGLSLTFTWGGLYRGTGEPDPYVEDLYGLTEQWKVRWTRGQVYTLLMQQVEIDEEATLLFGIVNWRDYRPPKIKLRPR